MDSLKPASSKASDSGCLKAWRRALAALALSSVAALAQAKPVCLASAQDIGPVRLGMRIQDIRAHSPHAVITRGHDEEGVAFVNIALWPSIQMTAYANEDDADAPIDDKRAIVSLQTTSPLCQTAGGVHPGMRLDEAARRFGALKRITLSEIEMREFASFARQPSWLTIGAEGGLFDARRNPPQSTRRHMAQARVVYLEIDKK